jgi:hypothetical protein
MIICQNLSIEMYSFSITYAAHCPTANFLQLFSIVALARYFPKDTADGVQLIYF